MGEDKLDFEDELRVKILAEIARIKEYQTRATKEIYRAMHEDAVRLELERNREWVQTNYPKYAKYFANGIDVIPSLVRPSLIEVKRSWHYDLFRLARFTWSLPYTRGYGRRLRFLIMDDSNEKLMGILGLQSPPLDFAVRDEQFSYPPGRKVELINQTLDIFTLGAVPPYGRLLGGKLIAFAAISDEVRSAYKDAYSGRKTEMQHIEIPGDLVALTTTSAFGRSSIYNRIKYKDRLVAESLGYTVGFGSFHLASLYPLILEYLEQQGISSHGGFGVGPRIVWQNYTRAFTLLGLPSKLLKHGIKREAFLFPLISNLKEYMDGVDSKPNYYSQSFEELAAWWKERWLLPRAERVDGWHSWNSDEIGITIFSRLISHTENK